MATTQIDITDSAKAYLDEWRTRIEDDTTKPLTYSQVIKRLKNRSWEAAHGGGRNHIEADEMEIEDEYGQVNTHTQQK